MGALNTQHNYIMKSKAALRFNTLHPDSVKDFQNILQTAKRRKESLDEESPDHSDEVNNMIKNKLLTKSREEEEEAGEEENILEPELDRGPDSSGLSLHHAYGGMNVLPNTDHSRTVIHQE